jgi:signal transduction histidine kinase
MAFEISNAAEETPAQHYAVDLRLHDETIQALYGVSLRLQAASSLVGEAPDALTGELDRAIQTIDNVIADLRDRIENLTSPESQDASSAPNYLRS